MAAGDVSPESGDDEKPQSSTRSPQKPSKPESTADESEDDEDEDEEEEEEEEEEEPRLKYATLTKSVSPLYRNGDATSTFLVAGDKMASRAHRLRRPSPSSDTRAL
jgi:hypothetical protein